ncbi:DAK2 domain protein [Lentilactobacillus parabuchneri]|uniref:DAK2 domain protein n=6 Tax=Lentilactobacillus parabuchneri TaxID=152331 RepID=A0A1X1FBN6_9LACO|nr:DAK2 domain-containing protein [Lentilactobacillus parabuchneri]APR08465.1 DAK2 domain protein [Lentilactobacillus parabuchneri]KRM47875.1 DAK2 domain fusion protein YloV [Lentilactobacillus parabuchneri DSM 5707 = NBRC 107865]KRN80105.1 DAK2 domain fusion protein YloV [Lentilactobacillus parabuchneri]MBW0221949.1 DAK2 domain-containing protein [Lentilactobacillus parabuchneri]MBW0244827.1 DAK2 domain-containing protein [Lentilactobacillus parabuchneri]
MKVTEITNTEFTAMVQAAATKLNKNADFINSLNVFPVPDGDTGTNMSLSMASGYKYVNKDTSQKVGDLSGALAKGLLMGARGNSGVILSQIFRGFSKSTEGKQTLSAQDISDAFIAGTEIAYKSVMKPTEGTILTVVRMAASAGKKTAATTNDVVAVMDAIYEASKSALEKTPDLLPVLKQVGVVDSGGQGLVFVLEAFDDVLNGRDESESGDYQPNDAEMNQMIKVADQSVQSKLNPEDIVYGYCTQIMVRIGKGREVDHQFDYQTFYDYLAKLGDSLLVINDDDIVKVHVHTEHPGKVLAWGQEFGDLATVKVDNMRLQQETIIENDDETPDQDDSPIQRAESISTQQPVSDTAIISVSSGKGLNELFQSLGVNYIVSGGQTMNPSTEDIVNAIKNTNAKQAIVLPNNKNIFLAAEQAAEVVDIPTVIVHSKTISQGITAMLGFNPENSLEDNQKAMEDNLPTVKSGQVTTAIRDTKINNLEIKKDQFMGIVDGDISTVGDDLVETAIQMVQKMLDEDSEAITIIYGDGADQALAEKVQDGILKLDDELEVEIHEGDQPVYPFLISVE